MGVSLVSLSSMSEHGENVTLANILSQFAQFANIPAQPSPWIITLAAILISCSIGILSTVFRSASDDKIHKLGGFQLIAAWNFFAKRYDFMREHFKKTGVNMFRFHLLQVNFVQHRNFKRLTPSAASRDCDEW